MTVSKALEQVWQWKQAVYEDIKDMDAAARLAYFRGARQRLEEKVGRKLDLPPSGSGGRGRGRRRPQGPS